MSSAKTATPVGTPEGTGQSLECKAGSSDLWAAEDLRTTLWHEI